MGERLRGAIELLEAIAADRRVLNALSPDDRERFQRALALVYHPDPVARRRLVKTVSKERRDARASRDRDPILNRTGIRELRRRPVVTTPNVFAPKSFEPSDVPRDMDEGLEREAVEPALLRLQAHYTSCTISTTSCVRRARSSTSPSAPSWPTCAAGWRC